MLSRHRLAGVICFLMTFNLIVVGGLLSGWEKTKAVESWVFEGFVIVAVLVGVVGSFFMAKADMVNPEQTPEEADYAE